MFKLRLSSLGQKDDLLAMPYVNLDSHRRPCVKNMAAHGYVQFCRNEWKGLRVTQIPRIFGPCLQRATILLHNRPHDSPPKICINVLMHLSSHLQQGLRPFPRKCTSHLIPVDHPGGSKGSRVSNYPSNLPSMVCIKTLENNLLIFKPFGHA